MFVNDGAGTPVHDCTIQSRVARGYLWERWAGTVEWGAAWSMPGKMSNASISPAVMRSRHFVPAAFGCDPTDVYVAVATVGDKIRDVRCHLRRVLGREEDRAATILHMKRLPPLWPTVS